MQRSRRTIRTPKRYLEMEGFFDKKIKEEQEEERKRTQINILRLLKEKEIRHTLKQKLVFVYKSEGQQWHPVQIVKLNRQQKRAVIQLKLTGDKEEAHLGQLVQKGYFAIAETKPDNHQLKEGTEYQYEVDDKGAISIINQDSSSSDDEDDSEAEEEEEEEEDPVDEGAQENDSEVSAGYVSTEMDDDEEDDDDISEEAFELDKIAQKEEQKRILESEGCSSDGGIVSDGIHDEALDAILKDTEITDNDENNSLMALLASLDQDNNLSLLQGLSEGMVPPPVSMGAEGQGAVPFPFYPQFFPLPSEDGPSSQVSGDLNSQVSFGGPIFPSSQGSTNMPLPPFPLPPASFPSFPPPGGSFPPPASMTMPASLPMDPSFLAAFFAAQQQQQQQQQKFPSQSPSLQKQQLQYQQKSSLKNKDGQSSSKTPQRRKSSELKVIQKNLFNFNSVKGDQFAEMVAKAQRLRANREAKEEPYRQKVAQQLAVGLNMANDEFVAVNEKNKIKVVILDENGVPKRRQQLIRPNLKTQHSNNLNQSSQNESLNANNGISQNLGSNRVQLFQDNLQKQTENNNQHQLQQQQINSYDVPQNSENVQNQERQASMDIIDELMQDVIKNVDQDQQQLMYNSDSDKIVLELNKQDSGIAVVLSEAEQGEGCVGLDKGSFQTQQNINQLAQNEKECANDIEEAGSKEVNESDSKLKEDEVGVYDPEDIAKQIEFAMYKKYSSINNKDYKTKAKTISFNLKDKRNPEFRLQIIKGQITADQLMTMTAEQMASRDFLEWKKKQQRELNKQTILDAEAAKDFVATAALRAQNNLRAEVLQNEIVGGVSQVLQESGEKIVKEPRKKQIKGTPTDFESNQKDGVEGQDGEDQQVAGDQMDVDIKEEPLDANDNQEIQKKRDPRGSGKTSFGVSAAVRFAAMRAFNLDDVGDAMLGGQQNDSRETSTTPNDHPDHVKEEPGPTETTNIPSHPDDRQRGSSSGGITSPQHSRDLMELDARILKSEFVDVCCGDEVWRGQLSYHQQPPLPATLTYIAGNGDFAKLLHFDEISIGGLVDTHKLEHFFKELKFSKSRMITLASLHLQDAASPEEKYQMNEMVQRIGSGQKSGKFASHAGDIEIFFLTRNRLSASFYDNAKRVMQYPLPKNVERDAMLVVFVHRKDRMVQDSKGNRPQLKQQIRKIAATQQRPQPRESVKSCPQYYQQPEATTTKTIPPPATTSVSPTVEAAQTQPQEHAVSSIPGEQYKSKDPRRKDPRLQPKQAQMGAEPPPHLEHTGVQIKVEEQHATVIKQEFDATPPPPPPPPNPPPVQQEYLLPPHQHPSDSSPQSKAGAQQVQGPQAPNINLDQLSSLWKSLCNKTPPIPQPLLQSQPIPQPQQPPVLPSAQFVQPQLHGIQLPQQQQPQLPLQQQQLHLQQQQQLTMQHQQIEQQQQYEQQQYNQFPNQIPASFTGVQQFQQQIQPQIQQQIMMHPHQQQVLMGNTVQQGQYMQQGDLFGMIQQEMQQQQQQQQQQQHYQKDDGRRQHRGDRRGGRDRDRQERYGRKHGRRHGGRGGGQGYDNFHYRQKRGADNSDSEGQRKRNRI